MKITHKISMDLDRYSVPGFDAVCGDRNTREMEITVHSGGAAYFAPAYYLDDIANVEIKVNANQVRHTINNSLVSDDRAVTNVIHGSA